MKILINLILIIILIVVWGVFYKRNIKNKNISTKNQILIVVSILSFNILSLYIFNISNNKQYFTDFGSIKISLRLNNLDNFLTDKKNDYKKLMKKDSVKIASEQLLRNKFNYNPKSKNKIKIIFSDSISYNGKNEMYILKLSLSYPKNGENKEIETYLILKNKKISYEKIISIYENTLTELLNSIFYNIGLKNKKPQELVSILTHKFNLSNINYIHIFNHLLKLENPPVLSSKVLLRFINNPATFSEATGYAIITNNCTAINRIIDKSIFLQYSPLDTLLSILVQSKCKAVKGYLTVLSSSQNSNISKMAKKYLNLYSSNKKNEFIYKNGKRIEEK